MTCNPTIRGWRAFGVACVVLLTAGCGFSKAKHPPADREFERLRSQSPDEPVATVEGFKLGVEDFQDDWTRHPELDVPTVIDRVVQREVAVSRALERGLDATASLDHVRKQAMVKRLLRREIEGAVGPEDLDEKMVSKIEEGLRRTLGRPAGIRASHLLVMVPGARKKKGNPSQADFELAKTWADKIRDSFDGPVDVETLFAARRRFEDDVPDRLRVVVNANLQFPAPDSRPFTGDLPSDWMQVVKPFRQKAGAMLDAGEAGELSAPVRSKYGWHLILPERRLEARVPEPDAVHQVAISRALRVERNKMLQQKVKEWRPGMAIEQYPSRISDETATKGE